MAPVDVARGRTTRLADGDVASPSGAAAGSVVIASPRGGGEPVRLTLDGGSFAADALPSPGLYDLSWHAGGGEARAVVERVACHYFELRELAEEAGQEDDLSGVSEARQARARAEATQIVERACGRSFTPRRGVAVLAARGRLLDLPWRDVASCELATESGREVPAELPSDCQCLLPEGLRPGVRLEASATYGLPEPPEEVRRAAVRLALYLLRRPARPDNAVGESTDYGFIRYSLAGRDGATGLVEVDAAIKAWALRGPVVA